MENSWRIIHKLEETIKISLGKYDLLAKILTVHLCSVVQPFLGVKSHILMAKAQLNCDFCGVKLQFWTKSSNPPSFAGFKHVKTLKTPSGWTRNPFNIAMVKMTIEIVDLPMKMVIAPPTNHDFSSSGTNEESPLAQQQQPDRLAAVIGSFEWPSRGEVRSEKVMDECHL